MKYKQAVVKWVNQACDTFNQPQLIDVYISFPVNPKVPLPERPITSSQPTVTITGGIGFLLGGSWEAALANGTTHAVNENSKQEQQKQWDEYNHQPVRADDSAAIDYLNRFSTPALSTFCQCKEKAEKVITLQVREESLKLRDKRKQLKAIHIFLNNFNRLL